MSDLNKTLLIGRLINDPELKTLPGGTKLCEFTMVTNDRFTDKSGERQEVPEFHNMVAWNNQAETIAQHKRKGHEMYVEAKKKTKSWENKDGVKQYKTELHVKEFNFIGAPASNDSEPANNGGTQTFGDDDLPFN